MNNEDLIKEIKKLGIEITKEQEKKLDEFYNLLIEWNKKINLTRITERKEVNLKHFYDSLTIAKIINLDQIESMCDLGTGAGFPGIVIKIIFPHIKITLLDSLNKRVIYLNEIIKKLSLDGIEAIHDRGENFARNNIERYDLVTARAVSDLRVITEISIPMIKVNGSFIAMKANVEEEIIKSEKIIKELNSIIENKLSFELPYENSTRTLIRIKKTSKNSDKFPRSMDKIKKELIK